MVKKAVLFFMAVTIFSFNAFPNAQRRNQLIVIIKEELGEVKRLSKRKRGRDPHLILRIAELFLEQARLIRDGENEKYLNIPYQTRRKKKKARYFRVSQSYFKKAQKTCEVLLRRHKRFRKKGDVYYIMAFNAKEFGRPKTSEKYFKLAIKKSTRNSMTHKKSQIALAEIFYNKKKYHKAINLYKNALTKNDKWWTKDAFNLAWSYLKVNQHSKAIGLMKEISRQSKKEGRYIDMRSNVERDLPYFYVYSGRINKAVVMYKRKGKDVGKSLIQVAKNAEKLGKTIVAKKILEDAVRYAKNDKKLKVKILITLLPIYEKYGNIGKHLRTSKELIQLVEQNRIAPDQREILIYQVKRMASLLQKQVASKKYRHDKKLRNHRGRMAIAYFSLTEKLEKGKSGSYAFHTGETLYALGRYGQAIEKHFKSLEIARRKGEKKIIVLSLNSLLSSLGQRNIPQKTKDKYLEKVYLAHIRYLPKSRKNEKISQRLFNFYMEKKDLTKAEKTLKGYSKLYPRRKNTQETMIAKIMDHYRKVGDRKKFFVWMNKIKKFEYSVSKKYMNQLKKIYLAMQFEKIDKINSKGDKKKALSGYLALYKSNTATAEVKKNAAYNLAVLFRDLGHSELTYRWTKQALSLMNQNDVSKYGTTFISLANTLFNQQEIKKSANINELILGKICKKKSKEKELSFTNASVLYLAENDFERVKSVISKGNKCRVSKKNLEEQKLALLKGFVEKKHWSRFEEEMKASSSSMRNYPFLIEFLERYRKALVESGRKDIASSVKEKIYHYYKQSQRKRYPIPLESLDVIANFEIEKLDKEKKLLESIKLRFPENIYNTTLKKKLNKIGQLEERAIRIMKIGSGIGIVKANRITESSYINLSREIASFTPPNKSKEYIEGFKKSMAELANSLTVKAKTIRNTARQQILRDKILSHENIWFLGAKSPVPFPLYYNPVQGGIIMDRGGRI